MTIDFDDYSVETAAPRAPVSKAPIDVLPSNMLTMHYALYSLFRSTIVAAYTSVEDLIVPETFTFLAKAYTGDRAKLTAEFLRSTIRVAPGDGKKPISLQYTYEITALPNEALATFEKVFGKGRSVPILRAAELASVNASKNDITVAHQKNYEALTEPVKTGYNTLEFYNGLMFANVATKTEDYPGYEGLSNITFTLTISVGAELYAKIVDSDKFSPYLVNMAIHNLLNSTTTRAAIVVDPRKTATLSSGMQKTYGVAKPRVNKDGFGVFQSGIPILIPREADFTEELLRSGDSSLDDEGFYDEQIMVTKGIANRIIYVDWLNDILAYTTVTGKLDVVSLIGTSALTPDVEFAYLQMKISDTALFHYFRSINTSMAEVPFESIAQNIDPQYRDKVPNVDINGAFDALYKYGAKVEDRLSLANLCGFDLDGIEDSRMIGYIMVYRAYVKTLYVMKGKDSSALKIPQNYASQGIRFRIVGLEYLLYTLATKGTKDIELLRKEWADENERRRVDPDQNKEFAIPNIKIGGTGLTGLLPHQGDIYSSMRKVPRLAILPIATGGGKSALSFLDALSGIQAHPGMRPIISTKGSLVKGTITEINRMTQGGINAIPLRAGVLRRLRKYGIDTFEKLLKWVRALPPNTIFVNAYSDYSSRSKIYKELPSIYGIGTKSVLDSQYLRIIRIISFPMTIGDESHLIKNPDSNRSIGAYSAFCSAEFRRIMSGTVVSNTVKDLVGQSNAISPLIFGNDPDAFCTRYGIEKGIIHDDATATKLKNHLRTFTAYHQATEDMWSYMLPSKDDSVTEVPLTPKQSEYYDRLMLAAYLELTGKGKPAKPSEEGDDDEEDDDSEDGNEEDEDEDVDENAFLTRAKKVFQTVEQFISAPDADEDYVNQADKPTGSDLVSPKVQAADLLIDKYLRAEGDPAKNKIIVFAINIDAVKHFIRHSRHAKDALVYFAGDYEALRQYATDPTKRIIIAAETSIREGENLQMTRAIIKMQVPWAPGDYKQAIARMYRPDPRGTYSRDLVNHDVILAVKKDGEPTLDNSKMARLISKFVSNARLTFEGDPRWTRVSKQFNDLDLITMNLDFIFKTTAADLKDYFGAWTRFVEFENDINDKARIEKARTIEASYGVKLLDGDGKLLDVQKFISLAMTKINPAPVIPGSKSVYTPWLIGALPADPDNLGFEILGSQPIHEGDVVQTEFGPGIVRRVSNRTVRVETYGGKLTGFRRTMVCTVPDANKPKLKAIVSDGKKWQAYAKDPMGKVGVTSIRGATSTTPVRDEAPAPPKSGKPVDVGPKKPTVDVNTAILNGMPSLVILNVEEDMEALNKIGWNRVDPYTSITFRTWNSLTNFLDQLETKAYVPPKVLEALDAEIEEFKHGSSPKLMRQVNAAKVRQFFADQRKKFGKKEGKYVVNPYIIAIDDEIRIAFDKDSHDTKVIQWLHRSVKSFTGVKSVKDTDGLYLKTFKDIAEARKHLSALVGVVTFDEADLTRELGLLRKDLAELMSARKRPM